MNVHAVPAPSSSGPSAMWAGLRLRPHALMLSEDVGLNRRPFSLFSGLSEAERARVVAHGQRRRVARGARIFNQGDAHDGIFVIECGRVRVYYNAPSGREITLAYWGPGHFVGGPNVFSDSVHQWTGLAMTGGSQLFFEGRVLRRLVSEIPQLAIGVIDGLSFKGQCYSTMAQMLGTRSVTERLAHLLLHLADAFGVESAEGILIADSFTHAELAGMVGSTRQWVTMSLKKLQDRGILAARNATITILRRDLLAAENYGAAETPRSR